MPTHTRDERLLNLRQQDLPGNNRQATGIFPSSSVSPIARAADGAAATQRIQAAAASPEIQFQRDSALAARGPQEGRGTRLQQIRTAREPLQSEERIAAVKGATNIATATAQQAGAAERDAAKRVEMLNKRLDSQMKTRAEAFMSDPATVSALEARIELTRSLLTEAEPAPTQQLTEREFATARDAEAAGLPPGTIVVINGRRARIR